MKSGSQGTAKYADAVNNENNGKRVGNAKEKKMDAEDKESEDLGDRDAPTKGQGPGEAAKAAFFGPNLGDDLELSMEDRFDPEDQAGDGKARL